MRQFLCTLAFTLSVISIFCQRELIIEEMNNDNDAVIEINAEDPSQSDFTQMILGFNASSQGWLRTTTNHDLSFWTNNTRRMTVKNNGRVGIGTFNPSTDFEVQGNTNIDGNLTQSGTGNSSIQSTNGSVTINTASATIVILPNGDIKISSSGNLDINADGSLSITSGQNMTVNSAGTLSIEAEDINMTSRNMTTVVSDDMNTNVGNELNVSSYQQSYTANEYIDFTTGTDLNMTANFDFNLTSRNAEINLNGFLNVDALGSDQSYDLEFDLSANGSTSIQGSQLLLNSQTGSQPAARVGDVISIPSSSGGFPGGTYPIVTGSSTVLIGN